jgi:hypothetical protein
MTLTEALSLRGTPDNLVWYSILDNKYIVTVSRPTTKHVLSQNGYVGILEIFDANGKILYTEEVGLAYGARFGPDVDDVYQWQEKVLAFIDKEKT